jgi:hypothetical protein
MKMNLSKKFIFLGLISIFIITSLIMFSFASEEKDYINQAIKLIDEEKYNEAAGELEEALALVKSKADLDFINVLFVKEEAPGFGMYNSRENITFTQGETSPFPAGNYKFRLVLKDVFSQKTTEVIIDFTVVE